METWVIFLILSIACMRLGVMTKKKKTPTEISSAALTHHDPVVHSSEVGSSVQTSPIPSQWSESAITAQLRQLRDEKPSLIPHFVASVKERFIVNQDDRTAQARIRFMISQIDQLKLAKDFTQLTHDLEILGYEREKRIKTIQLETEEIESKRRNRGPMDALAATRERKKIELEIAQLDQQIDGLKNTQKPSPRPSPEQVRANRHAEIDARLVKLKEEKQKVLKIQDEQERILKVNAIDDEIQRLAKEWGETL
jgi:hypothetical protein